MATFLARGQREGSLDTRLRFGRKYGLAPTLEAFKVKRPTLYHWRRQLRVGSEDLEALNEKSKTLRLRRKRLWPKEVTEEIRRLMRLYPISVKRSFTRRSNFSAKKES
jgi:transposase-like protein